MWIFTKYGFFSAVSARRGNGRHGNPVDPGRIMVRARRREHLEALCTAFDEQLGKAAIMETATTDYRYRIVVDKPVWGRVMAALVDGLDYDNFKDAAAHLHGHGSAYVHALHAVWEIGRRMQAVEPERSRE